MLNKVILIGRLGKDPDIRTTQSGERVANMSLATSESWRDKSTGERRERAEWHTVIVWNDGLVKVIEQYVKKGSKIYVEGQLQTRKWQDRDGNDRYSTEIVLKPYRGQLVLLGDKSGDGQASGQTSGGYADKSGGDYGAASGSHSGNTTAQAAQTSHQRPFDDDEDIPF